MPQLKPRKKNPKEFPFPFSIPLFIIFILFLTSVPLMSAFSLNPVSLYKCSENFGLSEQFFEIPDVLRIQYSDEKLNYSKNKFGDGHFFKFSLTNDTRKNSCFKSESSVNPNSTTFTLEIPTVLDVEFESSFEFSPDGFLIHYDEDGTSEIYYHPENYCVQEISKEKIFVKVCKSQCHFSLEEKGEHPCLLKCCPIGQVMTFNSNITEVGRVKLSCQDALGEDWTPSAESESGTGTESGKHPNLFYSRKKFKCDENELFSQGKTCFLPAVSKWRGNTQKFCADGFWDSNKYSVYNPEKSQQFTRQCQSKPKSKSNSTNSNTNANASESLMFTHGKKMLIDPEEILFHGNVLFSVALVASVVHLLTLIVYISLGTSRKVHGLLVLAVSTAQCLLNVALCACAAIAVFLGPRAWFHHDIKPCSRILKPNLTCLSMGILHQFLLISSFSWTTTLTFDAWTKITSLKPTSSVSSRGRKCFLKYCLFGFGFPLSFVSLSIFVEFGISSESGLIRPGFTRTCVILEGWNYFIYITIPLIILFILNMTMALLTLQAVLDAKKDMRSFKDSHTSSSFKNKTSLILKLFVLMGVFLCFEILVAIWSPIKISRYFAIFDFYRIGNALGLFWIFVMNKKVHNQLSDRYPIFTKYLKSMSRNTTVTNLSKEFSSNSK